MRTSNKNLFHGRLRGTAGEASEVLLVLGGNGNELCVSPRHGGWGGGTQARQRGARKREIQLGKHVDEEYF